MRHLHCAALAGAALLPSFASAQTTSRLRVESLDPPALHASLLARGFDVSCSIVDNSGFEAFASADELIALQRLGVSFQVLEKGRPLREIEAERALTDGVPGGYPSWTTIVAEMQQAAADHPAICELVDLTARYGLPLTADGNSILAVHISDNVSVDEDEPAVLVASCHHAREIVTPVIALEAIERLTDDYGSVGAITSAVDAHDIWILPVMNPDGYEYVFNVDNNWRKNRRVFPTGIGVDQNRNYPQGWNNGCSGSTSASSGTYKGPSPASEVETQALLALSDERRFAKVVDFHSSGRETLWGYDCPTHPFDSFYQSEAAALSTACGYFGDERRPSADGEHQQWHHGRRGSIAFLVETHSQFQPSYASAQSEAAQVQGGIAWLLGRSIPLTGQVTDLCSGAPLAANITYVGLNLPPDEENSSGGTFGRYYAYLPPGNYTLRFEVAGYAPETRVVNVGAGSTVLDVEMGSAASGGISYCNAGFNSVGLGATLFHTGSTSVSDNDFTLEGVGMPAGQFGLFLYGMNATQQPLFDGFLCVDNPFIRLPVQQTTAQGTLSRTLDLTAPPVPSGLITAGSTWNFQIAYRDPAFGQTGSNLSQGWRVAFCP